MAFLHLRFGQVQAALQASFEAARLARSNRDDKGLLFSLRFVVLVFGRSQVSEKMLISGFYLVASIEPGKFLW